MKRVREYMQDCDWRRFGRIALVFLPVIVWDVFYTLLCKLKSLCDYVDEEGGNIVDEFVNGD